MLPQGFSPNHADESMTMPTDDREIIMTSCWQNLQEIHSLGCWGKLLLSSLLQSDGNSLQRLFLDAFWLGCQSTSSYQDERNSLEFPPQHIREYFRRRAWFHKGQHLAALMLLSHCPGGAVVKKLPSNEGDTGDVGLTPALVSSLGVGSATHSSVLAWIILGTEKSGRLPSMESQRVRHI